MPRDQGIVLPVIAPASQWDDIGNSGTVNSFLGQRSARTVRLVRTRVNSSPVARATTETHGSASNAMDILGIQYQWGPMAPQTISGTFRGQIRAGESGAGANFMSQVVIRVVGQDGTVRGTLYGGDTRTTNVDEMAQSTTVFTNRRLPNPTASPVTLTSVAAQVGDYLVVEIGARAQNTSTTAFIFRYVEGDNNASDLSVGGTETTDLNPWVEFSQDLILQSEAATPVQLSGEAGMQGTAEPGTLTVRKTFSGEASAQGTLEPAVALVAKRLAGETSMLGALEGAIRVIAPVRLSGEAGMLLAGEGSATVRKRLSGEASSLFASEGAAAIRKRLAGESGMEGALLGSALVRKTLQGELSTLGTLEGARPVVGKSLAGEVGMLGSLDGAAVVRKTLSGEAGMEGAVSGAVLVRVRLSGAVGGEYALEGTLTVPGSALKLSGEVGAIAGVEGALTVRKMLSGEAGAEASSSGLMLVRKVLAGEAGLSASVEGEVLLRLLLSGEAGAVLALEGALFGNARPHERAFVLFAVGPGARVGRVAKTDRTTNVDQGVREFASQGAIRRG